VEAVPILRQRSARMQPHALYCCATCCATLIARARCSELRSSVQIPCLLGLGSLKIFAPLTASMHNTLASWNFRFRVPAAIQRSRTCFLHRFRELSTPRRRCCAHSTLLGNSVRSCCDRPNRRRVAPPVAPFQQTRPTWPTMRVVRTASWPVPSSSTRQAAVLRS